MILDSHPKPSGAQLTSQDSESLSEASASMLARSWDEPAKPRRVGVVLENLRVPSWKGANDWPTYLILQVGRPRPAGPEPTFPEVLKIRGLPAPLPSLTPLYGGGIRADSRHSCCSSISATQPGEREESERKQRDREEAEDKRALPITVFCWELAPWTRTPTCIY